MSETPALANSAGVRRLFQQLAGSAESIVVSITEPKTPTKGLGWFNPVNFEFQIFSGLDWVSSFIENLTIGDPAASHVTIDSDAFTAYDDAGNIVFKAYLSGADVGDVVMGNPAGTQYAKYDKSAGTFAVTAALTAAAGSSIATSYLSGLIAQANLNVANRGWTQTSAFSVTDADTVSWGAGTFTSADGTAYSILAGNTGNMSAKTYIYLDTAVSTTAYQVTTNPVTALGVGKVLVAVAQNGTARASFSLVEATQVTADNILVNTLAAISADLGNITAGTIIVVSGGNTVAITPGATNAIISGPTGSPTFILTAAGAITATMATITGALTAGAGSSIPTGYLSGIVGLSNTNVAAQGWTFNGVFSSTDYNTIAWTAGTFTTAGGTNYSIDAGNTGNMAAFTYIYLDTAVSTTVLQTTTTPATAVGSGKVLIAIASPNTDITSDATLQVFGGKGGMIISVDNIAANSASVNELISNSAQIANAIITNAHIIELAVSKLLAGAITSKSIELAMAEGTGDCEIRSGIATGDFANAGAATGFIFGIDDSDSNKVKFYFGSPTEYLKFDGTTLTLVGGVDISAKLDKTGGAYNSASSGARVRIFPDANTGILVEDSAANAVFKALVGGTDAGDVIMGDEASGQCAKWDESTGEFKVNNSPISNQDVYGDGSDGNLTVDTDITLTRDMFYNNVTFVSSSSRNGVIGNNGHALRTGANSVYSTLRTSAGTAASSGAGTNVVQLDSGTTADRYDTINRGMLVFDTSALPDGCTIASATLRIYVTAVTDNFAQLLSVVTRTDPSTIDAADYNIANWTMTRQASDTDLTGMATGAYLDIPLNATGLSNISKTASTILGLVLSHDCDASAPVWSSNLVASVTYQDSTGANPPQLVVNYTYATPKIETAGYRMFVKGILGGDVPGSLIQNNGGNGVAGTNAVGAIGGAAGGGGAVAPGVSVPPSQIGVGGGLGGNGDQSSPAGTKTGAAGTAGTSAAKAIGDSNGVAGVAGGGGGTYCYAGGAGGAAGTKSGTIYNKVRNVFAAYYLSDSIGGWTNFTVNADSGGSGGGGGGKSNGSTSAYGQGGGGGGGAGSGGGGGIVWVAARIITWTGTFKAVGGNGAKGGDGADGAVGTYNGYYGAGGSGGGGGCGGTGGIVIILTSSSTATYSTSVVGGTAGNGGTKGLGWERTAGGVLQKNAAFDGVNGTNGTNGNNGVVITLII